MKLNPDCIRDVLLKIEELQTMDNYGNLSTLQHTQLLQPPLTDKYAENDINYSVKQLCDSGYIQAIPKKYLHGNDLWLIKDISPLGHEFLQNTRDNTVWSSAKEKAKAAGSVALDVIAQVAAGIIASRLGI